MVLVHEEGSPRMVEAEAGAKVPQAPAHRGMMTGDQKE